MNIQSILIANRGEIAVRIIRACREMGIRTIAAYSDADASALHVRLADQAVHIGGSAPTESYLNIPRIIEAARMSGADAIHPGYGFLAENADFAEGVRQAGLTFIGPNANAIRVMGDKAAARTLMQERGIPVVPGYQGHDDLESLVSAATEIGYPVLVKSAAGGGGKGMRVVASLPELNESVESARREAKGAFGDSRLILEKYISIAHHIEFQVFADGYGNTIHLFERECSIQRRHQKLIEETPSPLMDEKLRRRMGSTAVEAARAVGYENAGTVEFIVNADTHEFYFLEMNTRLQVEHPVTELTTGLDLVQMQIRIAGGEPLPITQDEVYQRGHAIECRVNAEDPANRFLPSTGKLRKVIEPGGPGVRVDSGFKTGDEITLYYDSLVAKVIVLASSREGAIRKMQNALGDYIVLGVTTNIDLLQAVLKHPDFHAGNATTTFVESNMARLNQSSESVPAEALIGLAIAEMSSRSEDSGEANGENDRFSPWKTMDDFRIGS